MDNGSDYILGTHDAEIERLGLQHRVWRPRMLDAWRRAGITTGQTIIDVGAGPGYAAIDLAEIVGDAGQVVAIERSPHFIAAMTRMASRSGVRNIRIIEADLMDVPHDDAVADASWCRWVLSFVNDPRAVVRMLAAALKPAGVAIFHEYIDYRTWRVAPRSPEIEAFVDAVMTSWRESGGEPDVALQLPTVLAEEGFEIIANQPLIDVVGPRNSAWRWPESFVDVNLQRLVDLGRIDEAQAESVRLSMRKAGDNPNALMVTPCVLEIIARRSAI